MISGNHFSKAEVAYIENNPQLTNKQLAKALNRNINSVAQKKHRMGQNKILSAFKQ